MNIRAFWTGATAILSIMPVTAQAAVKFESVSINSLAYIETSDTNGNEIYNYSQGANSASTLPTALLDAPSTIAGTSEVGGVIQSSATDMEDVSATFLSASTATVRASGSTTADVLASGAGAYAGFGYGNQVIYDFNINKTSNLAVDYQIEQPAGELFGAYGYYSIQTIGAGSTFISSQRFTDTSGNISISLAPGDYGLVLIGGFTNDVAQQSSNIGMQSRMFSDLYTVDISTPGVPEPATWALMLVGFGGTGVAIRTHRRRQKVQAESASGVGA